MATVIIIAATSLGIGFYLGSRNTRYSRSRHNSIQTAELTKEQEDGSELSDGDLAAIQATGPCKMVLIVRTDLKMEPGEISVQYVSCIRCEENNNNYRFKMRVSPY